jgi:hypothetical protein
VTKRLMTKTVIANGLVIRPEVLDALVWAVSSSGYAHKQDNIC